LILPPKGVAQHDELDQREDHGGNHQSWRPKELAQIAFPMAIMRPLLKKLSTLTCPRHRRLVQRRVHHLIAQLSSSEMNKNVIQRCACTVSVFTTTLERTAVSTRAWWCVIRLQ